MNSRAKSGTDGVLDSLVIVGKCHPLSVDHQRWPSLRSAVTMPSASLAAIRPFIQARCAALSPERELPSRPPCHLSFSFITGSCDLMTGASPNDSMTAKPNDEETMDETILTALSAWCSLTIDRCQAKIYLVTVEVQQRL